MRGRALWRASVGVMLLLAASCSETSTAPPPDASLADAEQPLGDAANLEASATEGDSEAEGSSADAGGLSIVGLPRTRIGSENSEGWDTRGKAYGDFAWEGGPFAKVALLVDLETSCFPFDRAPRPPRGQNWPASCDAFDRNLDLFIDDSAVRSADAEAGIDVEAGDATPDQGSEGGVAPSEKAQFEVVHAVTPFGGPLHLEVDVTDLANAQPGPHRLQVNLGSYSDPDGIVTGSNAGWTVTAHFAVTPGRPPRRVLAAIPLFAGEVTKAERSPPAVWKTPEGTTSARLEYRTSGHGGVTTSDALCNGPAEEFCVREHRFFVDGSEFRSIEPFRRDCPKLCTLASVGDAGFAYCQENPTGDMRSVRASRANWCPGSMTAPFVWDDIAAYAVPGEHQFAFQIPALAPGGLWLVSATYYAYGEGVR